LYLTPIIQFGFQLASTAEHSFKPLHNDFSFAVKERNVIPVSNFEMLVVDDVLSTTLILFKQLSSLILD